MVRKVVNKLKRNVMNLRKLIQMTFLFCHKELIEPSQTQIDFWSFFQYFLPPC